MLEVLSCSLTFSNVSQQISQVYACPEMLGVQSQTLLVIEYSFLKVFCFLMQAANVEEYGRLRGWGSFNLRLQLQKRVIGFYGLR